MSTNFARIFLLVALLLAAGGTLHGQLIDNSTVTIINSFEAFPGYDVDYAIDTGDDQFISDYASRGGREDTFIEFDFGQPITFKEILYTDRVTSGGPNFAWFGGFFDYNTGFSYTFSNDDNFTNGDGNTDDIVVEVFVEQPAFSPITEDEIELMQTLTPIPNITARFLRWQILETNGANPGANDFQFTAGPGVQPVDGDFNGDGDLTDADIDALSAARKDPQPDRKFDVNNDSKVDQDDSTVWVRDLAKTWFGDANLDREFNSSDFVQVFQAGLFETGQPAGWAKGDWNGDMVFDSSDFVAAFQDGGFERGPRVAAAAEAVPEPSAAMILLAGMFALIPAKRLVRDCG